MESLKEIFKDKNFSDESLFYLENAINEFEEIFGDYVSRTDLIERIKRCVNGIEFTEKFDKKEVIGCYSTDSQKIQILNSLEGEDIKTVFFHEFLHAISFDGENVGFERKYTVVDIDEEDEYSIYLGKGWNEGFVQMLTQERNPKATNKNYPILTSSVSKFTNLFGKRELIDLYFNHAEDFSDFMHEKTNQEFSMEFLKCFDIIHDYEKEIIRHSFKRNMTGLLGAVFESKRDIGNSKLKNAQERLIQIYLDKLLDKKIENITELEEILKNVNEIYGIFSKTISVETIHKLIEQSDSNVLNNLDELDFKTRLPLIAGIKFEKFKKSNSSEKIEILMDENFLTPFFDLDFKEYPSLSEEYFLSIASELYSGVENFQDRDVSQLLGNFSGIAKFINQNNLSFENLKIKYREYNEYSEDGFLKRVYELYYMQENGEYEKISTFVIENYDIYDIKEYTEIESDKLKDLREKIRKEYSIEISQASEDGNGNYVAYDDVGQVLLFTELGEIYRPDEENSFDINSVNETKLEILDRKLINRKDRLKKLQMLNAPDSIIQHENELIEKITIERNEVLEAIRNANFKKITPSQIESRTIAENVTMESLQSTIELLLDKDKSLDNEGEEKNDK